MQHTLNWVLAEARNPVFVQIDLKDCTFKIRDGSSPTPNELTIKIGEGNLTYTENVEREYTPDRGVLDEVRDGDEQPLDVTFDFTWEFLRGGLGSGDPPTVEDALKNRGNAAGWVSADSDPCRPFAVDIVVEYVPACGVGALADMETYTFPDFRHDTIEHDFRAGTVSVTGRCNVTEATVIRAPQPSV
jgi:hypothetical protein